MNISIKTVDEMKNLHQKGWSLRKIGNHFNMHQQTVKWYLTRYLDYDVSKVKQDNTDEILNLYEKGYTSDQIAKELNVSKATIFRRIKKHKGG